MVVANDFAIVGKDAIIFLRRKDGPSLTCWIDKRHLRRALTRTWIPKWNPTSRTFYARCNASPAGPGAYLHRFLLNITDPAVEIDHDDHDGLNNRRVNLRKASRSINQFNRHGANRDKMYNPHRHVYWNKNLKCYWVGFQFDGERYYFGIFYDLDEAVMAAEEGRRMVKPHCEGKL